MLFQQFLHNKQLKFGLLVPVGLLMHEQSQKKDHPFTHNPTTEKVLHKKMKISKILSIILLEDNGPTGI